MEQARNASLWERLPWKWGIVIGAVLLLFGWLLTAPPGLLGKMDAIGYSVCHRIDERSFHIDGRALPLCVRCTGQYLGAVLGLAYLAVFSPRRSGMPGWRTAIFLVVFVLAYAVDGFNSYIHLPPLLKAFPDLPRLYEPNHFLRLVTGTGMGLAIASILYPAFISTVYSQVDARPALQGLLFLGGLVLLAAALDALVLLESPILLYGFALISSLGVLILLTMVYTVVWLIVLRRENTYQNLGQLVFPLVAGFGLALAQIVVVSILRYALTGTWGGFHLG
ncbi:MAG: DUF2085 domain-containing protein [Anaerolineales bacterium]|nr:DUF2085 domain-containing protein [Anaerolineales bacterium]